MTSPSANPVLTNAVYPYGTRHTDAMVADLSRRACEYPSTCNFCAKGQDVCFGGEDLRRDPLGSGKFRRREPHHAAERAALVATPEET